MTRRVMPLGPYKDKSFDEIYEIDPNYLHWCLLALDNRYLRKRIEEFIEDIYATQKGIIEEGSEREHKRT